MRILALYNTRGMVAPLELLRKRHLEHCDLFVHCGNSLVDYSNEFIAGYVVIRGSDDFENHYLRDYVVTLENNRILMMNNFEYRGEEGLSRLSRFVEGLDDGIDIVICAVSDHYSSQQIGNIVYVSPGDANAMFNKTYAIIEADEHGVRVSFFDIPTGALKETRTFDFMSE